ncbi:N-terminal domain of DJ-1_PfpI family protein [Bordetella holmesii 30539]|nr:N-terminal domain of DJ-1_PfpI family protein [Bordetella holmesii ATCC 51541]EWM45043.1 N-terminal domain of DJ-1_PfpI family protein [Bordetella holmesii 70147]EXF88363.1 N-terminal domain of DJ-1_PfpI family protein [Bordetella holmesii 30539]EXX94364.1 N-terminal domain of DJ-1_PfpI family protein [Bordetella holmesii 1058]
MVLTSHERLGDTDRKTGFWLEEFTAPFYVFKDAGAHITLASPRGGQPPLDPQSQASQAQTESTRRFDKDIPAQAQLAATERLADIRAADVDALFYPGGHGPLWDLAENRHSLDLIEALLAAGKPVGAVCHAPGVLRHAKTCGGEPLVAARRVTGFSNAEEAAMKLTHVVPFLVEDELKRLGADYSAGPQPFAQYVVRDGLLITGQNPASSAGAAQALLAALARD